MRLKAKAKDPFSSQQRVYRINWILASLLGVQTVVMLGCIYVIVVVAVRPPTVVVKDHVNGCAPKVVEASTQQEITAMDAKVFLIDMLKLRFQWNSATVTESMRAYKRNSMESHSNAMSDYLQEPIPVDPKYPEVKLPRLGVWVQSRIRRTLVLPETMDRIECTPTSADGLEDAWHCTTKAKMITSPLFGSDKVADPETVMVVATFAELTRTYTSHPHGLLIGTMEFSGPTRRAADPRRADRKGIILSFGGCRR
jgi:hypothetical protein